MISAAVLDAMVASGCTPEQIAAAVKAAVVAHEAEIEAKREYERNRKRNYRAGKKSDADTHNNVSQGQSGTSGDNAGHDGTDRDNGDTVSLSPDPLLPPTPPNNPLTPNPIQTNKTSARNLREKPAKRGHRLPSDWTMNGPDLAYALGKGLTERESGDLFERFCSWAWSASGPNAVKVNWHQAWQGWVQRDGPKIIAARASPSGKPLTEFQRQQVETNGIRSQLRAVANSGRSGGQADRVLFDDTGQQPAGIRGGTGAGFLALSGISDRGGDRSG